MRVSFRKRFTTKAKSFLSKYVTSLFLEQVSISFNQERYKISQGDVKRYSYINYLKKEWDIMLKSRMSYLHPKEVTGREICLE